MHLVGRLKRVSETAALGGRKSLFVTNKLFPIDEAISTQKNNSVVEESLSNSLGVSETYLKLIEDNFDYTLDEILKAHNADDGQRQKSLASMHVFGETEGLWFPKFETVGEPLALFDDSKLVCHVIGELQAFSMVSVETSAFGDNDLEQLVQNDEKATSLFESDSIKIGRAHV